MNPYEHFTIDIETANGEPTEAERWMRTFWSPAANWKEETIGRRYLEALEKKKERLALLDVSPIICISIQADAELRCLHCMREEPPKEFAGGLVEGFATERKMLQALRNIIEARTDEATAIIGHNIRGFDLPKLRHAFIRSGLKIPVALVNREQPVFDTMIEYGRGFSLVEKPFISVADLAEELRIPHHKGIVDGASIPELFTTGQFDTIIAYAMLDVRLECEIFNRMTGQAPDIEPPAYIESPPSSAAIAINGHAAGNGRVADPVEVLGANYCNKCGKHKSFHLPDCPDFPKANPVLPATQATPEPQPRRRDIDRAF